MPFTTPKTRCTRLLLTCIAALYLAPNALAADVLKRKSGLWEITSKAPGEPESDTEVCVNQTIEDPVALLMPTEKGCRAVSFRHFGNEATAQLVCENKSQGATSTIDAKFSGDFASSYKGTLDVLFDPPMFGQREWRVTMEAHWVGPCKR